ncbi:MAG: competence/damage-inducible protein A [Deltaproteobacteria bacterium]|nr:competence/damage-inducible protein A [Deltaproteobacteria bacterium]
MEKAVIISTGEELVTGRVVDTNSTYIADQLFASGVEVVAVLKVGDSRERLLWALREATDLGDLIIGTGGLGPTADDISTAVVAEFFGRKLTLDEEVAQGLKHRFESRGYPWTPNNLKQAFFPEGAEIVPNPLGTAPGFRLRVREQKAIIWLSGVPKEMKLMLKQTVLPWVAGHIQEAQAVLQCTFKIHGLTESRLDDIVAPILFNEGEGLAFRAHYPDLSLRLTVRGGINKEARFQELKRRIRELILPYIYGEGDETLEEVLGKLLREKGWTLALAESCTGGAISHRITKVAGSSTYFKCGAVTYSNESKIQFLQVKNSTLQRYGAVSRETALEMAQGLRRAAEADIALSVTGIAGPTGGTPEKPVGTVWVGIAFQEQSEARLFHFYGDREHIILGTSQAALNWLRLTLLKR